MPRIWNISSIMNKGSEVIWEIEQFSNTKQGVVEIPVMAEMVVYN